MAVEACAANIWALATGLRPRVEVNIKLSTLLSECQDMAHHTSTSSVVAYEEIRNKVMTVAGNRLQMSTSVPMDIG